MPPAAITSTSASGSSLPPMDAFASLSIAPPVGAPSNRSKHRIKFPPGLNELGKCVKDSVSDIVMFAGTMTGLPLIRDAVDGVRELQDWKSCRDELNWFRQVLEQLLAAFETYDQYPAHPVYRSPTMVEFKRELENLLAQVQMECARQSPLHYDTARKLLDLEDEYKYQALAVVQHILIVGVLKQQDVNPPK
ncbi:hypothetical protein FRC08_014941 [Ceratobasidium sp. 394]|nr:hypothetical protein FRC08_014941 [Ceratobasidium sp. 394]KAG9098887.1 hypothetical protein FS749_002664 [Ceratobasidium sp. UAMH 11750]